MVLTSEQVGVLRISPGIDVAVNHTIGVAARTLVNEGLVDSLIVDSEDGFSDLGMMREFVSLELGIGRRDLVQHALAGFPETPPRHNRCRLLSILAPPAGQAFLKKHGAKRPHFRLAWTMHHSHV